jgi:hypothetical protein
VVGREDGWRFQMKATEEVVKRGHRKVNESLFFSG